MSHLAFDVSAAGAPRAAGVPMPPGLAALSIPERMAQVIRARRLQGCPTTERDFLEAVETCDLSVAELHANIGTAKRLVHPELVRHDQPAAPVQPWDHDREYRAERVSRAVATLAAALEAERRHLRGRYSDAELTALWPDIVAGLAARLASGLPRLAATLARQGE